MMPLHRRHVGSNTKDDENNLKIGPIGTPKMKKSQPQSQRKRRQSIFLGLGAIELLFLVCVLMLSKFKSHSQLISYIIAAQIISLPAMLTMAVAMGLNSTPTDLPHQRYIPLVTIATIVGGQLPIFLSSAMANGAIVVFGLASRPVPISQTIDKANASNANRFAGPLGTVLAAILMTSMLLVENFFIWVVSATYKPSQNISTLPTPLQDNGQIILRYIFDDILELTKHKVVNFRNQIAVEWILVSGLGLSLVALEMDGARMKRSLWSMARRALLTLAFARATRTFSFLITVLPSQNPRCYFSHFPNPPPEDWYSWLMTGLIPQANGGCNDLIISGHATITSTLACLVTSIVGKPMFTTAIWMFLSIDYMVEIYEGFHYSVDMWLGAVLVNFIWTTLAPLEEFADVKQGCVETKTFYPLEDTTTSDLIKYLLPAVVSYLQLNGLIPFHLANYTIISYFLVVIYRIATFGFEQYTQHMLICVLFMSLGIYL